MVCCLQQVCTEWLLFPLLQVRRELHTTHSTVPQPFHHYGGTYSFRSLAELPNPSAFPTWLGGVFSSRKCYLVILVWWSDIRLMNLLAPGWHSTLLLDHTFILVLGVKCAQTRLWGFLLFGPGWWECNAGTLFYTHRLHWHTKTGCTTHWWGWYHAFFSLFRLSIID